MKAKRLTPHIAGIVIENRFDSRGRPWLFSHVPVYFEEIEDDWKNWPTPSAAEINLAPDSFDVIVTGISEPKSN